jgi:[ribosomal protein S18]-alanine N-acetyltransferase
MIRNANLHDVSCLLEIENICFRKERFNKHQFKYQIKKSNGGLIVYESNESICAYASFLFNNRYHYTRLYSIAVMPNQRQKNIASELLHRIEMISCYRKLNHIRLEVRKTNKAARKLYENNDYKLIGVKDCYYRDGEQALIYKKDLQCR